MTNCIRESIEGLVHRSNVRALEAYLAGAGVFQTGDYFQWSRFGVFLSPQVRVPGVGAGRLNEQPVLAV